MIALVIIGIGAALAGPMFGNLIESSRLTTSTNSLVEALALARSEAVRRRDEVEVVPIGGNWSQGWIVQTVENDTELSRFDAIPAALTLDIDDGVDSVEFQASGMRSFADDGAPGAVTVTICSNSGKGREITVGAAGNTVVERIDSGCGT
jgi:type IV fimbrial biogenesis protein FimT